MQQMKELVKIKIPFGILEKKGFTFENRTAELLDFYKIVNQYTQKGV